jgi:hypothetical protein
LKGRRIAGAVLVLAAILGFLTVADDLDHKGELAATSAVLLAGLVLFASSFTKRYKRTEPL